METWKRILGSSAYGQLACKQDSCFLFYMEVSRNEVLLMFCHFLLGFNWSRMTTRCSQGCRVPTTMMRTDSSPRSTQDCYLSACIPVLDLLPNGLVWGQHAHCFWPSWCWLVGTKFHWPGGTSLSCAKTNSSVWPKKTCHTVTFSCLGWAAGHWVSNSVDGGFVETWVLFDSTATSGPSIWVHLAHLLLVDNRY